MTNIDFAEWLGNTLSDRDIKPVELARLARIDPGVVSRILNAERKPNPKTLEAIAHALKLPTDLVFEKAGLLPPKIETSPIKRKLAHMAEGLPDSDIEMVIALLEQREAFYKKNPQAKPAK
jgi:transcriptional regulator with XRE-family HTH domain